jgi:GNAT superfamily N-acetyltransferase
MEITLAGRSERAAVLALLEAQLAEHAIELASARLAAAVDGALADPSRGVLLGAREGGEAPVGVAYLAFTWTIEHGGCTAWLEELYVVPARRGHGIGTALLRAVCDRARAEGCAAVDLEVEADHERAIALYARHGFRRLTRTRFALVLGHDRMP